MIDLNELQIFAQVVEANGFAAAGRRLGLPVSTVSRAVSRLERRLGAQLLHRTTRRLGLTDAGLVYYRHCERLLAEAAAAEAAIGGFDLAPKGVLRISAPTTFGRCLLAPLALLRAYPGRMRLEAPVWGLWTMNCSTLPGSR